MKHHSASADHDRLADPFGRIGVSNVLVHQVAPALFSATDVNDLLYKNEGSADPLSESLFSRFGDLEQVRSSDGRFYFRVEYANGVFAEWSQTSNPVSEAIAGFNLTAGGGGGFTGMRPKEGTGQSWIDGTAGVQWWWAVGTWALYQNLIPAISPVPAASVTLTVTKVN